MTDEILVVSTRNSIRSLTLNRPQVHNALNFELAESLAQALEAAASTPELRVVLLRGAGEAFCAGGDLKRIAEDFEHSDASFRRISLALNRALQAMASMPAVVVAALRGPAYAAGFGLALGSDLLVASDSPKTRLSPSFANVGLSPNAATTYWLARCIGPRRAAEAFIFGRSWSAFEARDLGLVQELWREAEFEERLESYLERIAAQPAAALAGIKKLLHCSFENDLATQLELERETIARASLSEDFRARVGAFTQRKR